MFSAVYLVCMVGQPCVFYVDSHPYPTEEVCELEATNNIARHKNKVVLGELPEFTAEFRCLGWKSA